MKKIALSIITFIVLSLSACNNMNKNGESTTAEGTTVDDRNNSDMENERTVGGADTLRSPGSNSESIEQQKGDYSISDEQRQIPQDNSGNQSGNDKTR